ncbi:MAG: FadR family transcriptional regulator [Ectothiorhodospiraceae bacterium]|nr:FadR family transcriptional regulator [Ectothiorhodospiraceae bacterium]MCH8503297.1 GntR family transcriptional regulator [Ectothiorhodospiraceae bacterium]
MPDTDQLHLPKLQVRSAYELVCRELEKRILDGTLRMGDRLPTETELAERFGVNRSTVREGIRRLESEGLVKRSTGRRLVVSLPRHSDLTPRTTRALALHRVTFRELWEVAMVMEPLAARLAAANATAPDLAAMERNLRETEEALRNGLSPAQLDVEFQALVARSAKNQALELSREPIGLLLYPAFEALIPLLPQAGERLLRAHREIHRAIRLRDGDTAFTWMHKHVADFRRGYELAGLPLDAPVDMPEYRGAGGV